MWPRRVIIVADDVIEISNLIAKFLEPFGYKVISARSGQEALELARTNPCDLVVTDIFMPGGGGLEVIQTLKQTGSPLRVLAISGGEGEQSSDSCLQRAKAAGADGALTKPFDRKQLLNAVETMLAS
jgi:CheY-like chemotaxis protein